MVQTRIADPFSKDEPLSRAELTTLAAQIPESGLGSNLTQGGKGGAGARQGQQQRASEDIVRYS